MSRQLEDLAKPFFEIPIHVPYATKVLRIRASLYFHGESCNQLMSRRKVSTVFGTMYA